MKKELKYYSVNELKKEINKRESASPKQKDPTIID
tara:strand:- start:819 stop:923 length:105 start_codon:yes stop_codon:yes gene_type:complete